MTRYTFIFLMVILVTLGLLIRSASAGNVTAIVVLTAGLTILLIALGAALTLFTVRAMANREQRAFRDNVGENLAMIKAIQAIQNQQNQALLKQVKALPEPQAGLDINQALEIEEGIFTELEDK